MKLDFKCMKCGMEEYESKSVFLTEKTKNLVGFEIGHYYLKVCINCGFTEMYSAKIIDKKYKKEKVKGKNAGFVMEY